MIQKSVGESHLNHWVLCFYQVEDSNFSYYMSPWGLISLSSTRRNSFSPERQANEVCLIYSWVHLCGLFVNRDVYVIQYNPTRGPCSRHCDPIRSTSIYYPNASDIHKQTMFYKLLRDLIKSHHAFCCNKKGDLKSLGLKLRPRCALKSRGTICQLVDLLLLELVNWSI